MKNLLMWIKYSLFEKDNVHGFEKGLLHLCQQYQLDDQCDYFHLKHLVENDHGGPVSVVEGHVDKTGKIVYDVNDQQIIKKYEMYLQSKQQIVYNVINLLLNR